MKEFIDLFSHLDPAAYAVITLNILLLIFARRILTHGFRIKPKSHQYTLWLMVFRGINFLIIFAMGYYYWYQPAMEKGPALKILAILAIAYAAYLLINLGNYLILKRYGKQREIEGKTRRTETYQTRAVSIFSSVFISIVALIASIHVLGFDSLLEAGGVIGFIGVFLALTQSTWAPDIFSGLIILNSDMLSEGDIIELNDGKQVYGLVYKTKLFHTEILNLIDNHRVMIRNARLRDFTIHNLSKFASARGLREKLVFKIGYDAPTEQVEKMFHDAFKKANESGIDIEDQHGLEIGIHDTGDHAVEWVVFYHTKNIRKLMRTRQQMMAEFYATSQRYGISLSTPYTHQLQGALGVNE
jgi:small-conductance mechanosensitive channel